MHLPPSTATILVAIAAIHLVLTTAQSTATSSTPSHPSKRGLVFTPDTRWPSDDQTWTQSGSDLAWYYNYQWEPSSALSSSVAFVPMLWGPPDNGGDAFRQSIERQLDAGQNITHVLTFNEPDGPAAYGGSNMDPTTAAQIWAANVEPLAQRGVKLGLPACTGGWGGIPWLQQFLGNCSEVVSKGDEKRNCTYDFVSIHWYGNFEGLASHLGSYSAAFPNVSQWVTEYGYADQDLETTQIFFNQSAEYLDRLDSVARYSYFGAFRAEASNVGPSAAMLSDDGRLTDLGSWYLGGAATGVDPESAGLRTRGETSAGSGVAVAVLVSVAVVLW